MSKNFKTAEEILKEITGHSFSLIKVNGIKAMEKYSDQYKDILFALFISMGTAEGVDFDGLPNEAIDECFDEWIIAIHSIYKNSKSKYYSINSGEKDELKHASIIMSTQFKKTWIPVEENLPAELQRCMFIVKSSDAHYHGKVYGGVYTGYGKSKYGIHEFSTPGVGFEASHWLPSPDTIVKPLKNIEE